MTQADRRSAVVIGAGAAGLATAAELKRAGVEPLVLERGSRPGESWHRRYEGLRLNSVRWMSSLPGYVMERRHGDFPSREAWASYLARYAERHELEVRFETDVKWIGPGNGGWRLETADRALRARTVVVATGMDHTPKVPEWPGRDAFGSRLIHSAEFRNAEPYRDQHVLVVGAGNSATEIAVLCARAGARKVTIAVRTPPLLLPPRFAGVTITAWAIPGIPLPDRLLDGASRLVSRLAVGDLSDHGLPPSPRGVSAQRREGYVAPIDRGFSDAVRAGAIDVVAAVEHFEGRRVVLANGHEVEPDAVIAATGYRTGLASLVGHLGVLQDDERPRVYGGAQLPHARGLFFVGYHYKLIPTLPHVSTEARGVAAATARHTGVRRMRRRGGRRGAGGSPRRPRAGASA